MSSIKILRIEDRQVGVISLEGSDPIYTFSIVNVKPDNKNKEGKLLDLINISNIDFEIFIKELPKKLTEYNNKIKIIDNNINTINKFDKIPKSSDDQMKSFLKNDDEMIYINPLLTKEDDEKEWRVYDLNLPFIENYEDLNIKINSLINDIYDGKYSKFNIVTHDLPNNIAKLITEILNPILDFNEKELLNILKKFHIPFEFDSSSSKIKKSTKSPNNIKDIITSNYELVNTIISNGIYNNDYKNILGLYLYNTCNIYIEFLLYYIKKLLDHDDIKKKDNVTLYLYKYIRSLDRLKVIVRNSFYNIFPPKRATTKYNIQINKDNKIEVIEDVYYINDEVVSEIYKNKIKNIKFDIFLKGNNKIYDAYDPKMILSIGGFMIENINPTTKNIIYKQSSIEAGFKTNKDKDKNNIRTNIRIINKFIKFIKEGIDSKKRDEIYENEIRNLDTNIKSILSKLKSLYEDNMKKSLEYLIYIISFESNTLNKNYNATDKLIESIEEAKILAKYYNNIARYILINTEKYFKLNSGRPISDLVKYFINPCKNIDEEMRKRLENEINKVQKKEKNIISNNTKTFNVTNYKEDDFWNRLQAIIYGNDFYIPIERSNEIYLLPIITTCKRGKISDDILVSETKYFYSKFKDNILYLTESKIQFTNIASLRYLPNSFYDELYDSNENKLRKSLYEILNSPTKYSSVTKVFNSSVSFVQRLIKYNNDIGLTKLLDNNRQIIAQNQIRAMIKSIR